MIGQPGKENTSLHSHRVIDHAGLRFPWTEAGEAQRPRCHLAGSADGSLSRQDLSNGQRPASTPPMPMSGPPRSGRLVVGPATGPRVGERPG